MNWVSDSSDVIVLHAGGAFLLIAPDTTGYGVTATTGDILKIANSGPNVSVTYDIVIIGVD